MVLFQFFDVIGEKKLTFDVVSDNLYFIISQCDRNAGISRTSKSIMVYILLPDDAIEKEHIITFDNVIGVLLPSDHRHQELTGLVESKHWWTAEFFYVINIFANRGKMYDHNGKHR